MLRFLRRSWVRWGRLQYEPGVGVEASVPIPEEFLEIREEYEIVWRFER